MRFGILRLKTLSASNVVAFILNTVTLSMFLSLTLYMQQVLGFSAMKTGVAYLAVAGTAIIWSTLAAQLVTRVGVKPVLLIGLTSVAGGLTYFTQISGGGAYVTDLLPGFLMIGLGLGFSFVPLSIAALAGVEPAEAGLASGLINTSQQIGGALGIAALATIAASRTQDAIAGGTDPSTALVSGFHAAFYAAVAVAVIGLAVALVLIRREELEQPNVEQLPVSEQLALDLAA
jgi:MFS family permease